MYITGEVIYTKGYSGIDGDYTRIIHFIFPWPDTVHEAQLSDNLLHCFSVMAFFRPHTAGSNDRTLVLHFAKNGGKREKSSKKSSAFVKFEQRYSRFSIKPK